jgi:8-oxo-dGTP diphosphatase
MKRHLQVACAIIERNGLILCAQRSATMSLPLKWEFPGGKIESGETAENCLYRELQEEMGIKISVGGKLVTATHYYATFSVTLHPFCCSIASGDITLHEHAAIKWLKPEELPSLDWAEADLPIITDYLHNNCRQ